MTSSRKPLVALLLASTALGAGAFAAWQWRAADNARHALASLAEKRAALEARLRDTSLRLASFEHSLTDLQSALDRRHPKSGAAPAPHPSASLAQLRASTAIASQPVSPNDPQIQNLRLAGERARFAHLYAPLFRSLKLSPSQIARFRETMMKRREQKLDLAFVMQSYDLPAQDPAIIQLETQSSDEFLHGLADALGQTGPAEVETFERKLPAWELVNAFAGTVALEGQPLSADQAVELVETIVAASPDFKAGATADLNHVDWPAAIAEATAVLTPRQAEWFGNSLPQYPIAAPTSNPPARPPSQTAAPSGSG